MNEILKNQKRKTKDKQQQNQKLEEKITTTKTAVNKLFETRTLFQTNFFSFSKENPKEHILCWLLLKQTIHSSISIPPPPPHFLFLFW